MTTFFDFVTSSEFLTAFWIFVGIVAGALVQHFLNRLTQRRNSRNALAVLKTEVDLNLDELERFRARIKNLREQILAGQISENEMFLSMQGFDYSAVAPLVNQGYFHFMLGPDRAKQYFEFMRFFNDQHGRSLRELLISEHQLGKSLACLDWIDQKATQLGSGLLDLKSARLKRGVLTSAS